MTEHTVRIRNEKTDWLVAKFDKLAARAARLGVPAPTLTLGEVEVVKEIDEVTGLTTSITEFRTVTAYGEAPHFEGWTFLACIERDSALPEGPHVVHVLADGVDADPAWRTLSSICEHCNRAIWNRKNLFVVAHESGERKIVGSTCIADFLGSNAVAGLVGYATWVADFDDLFQDDDDEIYSGPAEEERLDLASFLAWVVLAIEDGGWVPRSKAREYGRDATADVALQLAIAFSKGRRYGREEVTPPTAPQIAEAEAATAWARSLDVNTVGNDYLANVAVVAAKPSIRFKDLGIAASIVSAYRRSVAKEAENVAAAKLTVASEFVGAIKDRIEIEGTVTFLREFDSDFGTRQLVKILSDEGNVFTWWASSVQFSNVGIRVAGKATVKGHDTYNGIKSTVITRAKLEDLDVVSCEECGHHLRAQELTYGRCYSCKAVLPESVYNQLAPVN